MLRRCVALKVLDLAAPTDDLATRLLQEVRILARLEHPGVVPVHDAGTLLDGPTFYCMKYVEGQTLVQYIVNKSLPDRLRLVGSLRGFLLRRDLSSRILGTLGVTSRIATLNRILANANDMVSARVRMGSCLRAYRQLHRME
jgi:serine/threonine protein kinase